MGPAMSAPVYLQPGELVTIGFDQTHDLSLISERLTADEYLGASVNTGSLNLLAGARHLAAAEGRPNRRPSLDQLCLYDFPAPLGPR